MHTGVEFHAGQVTASMFPRGERLLRVATGHFLFSRKEPITAFSSACTIAVLTESNGRYGLYHGPYHRKEEMKKYSGHTAEEIETFGTLEDFLNAWNSSRSTPIQAAYLFATGFVSDISEQEEHRQDAIRLIKDKTGLPNDRILIRWNNYYEGETTVIVDPQTRIIKVNFYF